MASKEAALSTTSTYNAPSTLSELLRALSVSPGTEPQRPLAGGTDLLVQMRAGRVRAGSIVDIKRIPGMIDIARDGDGFAASAPHARASLIGEHDALREAWPGVVEAANLIGSTQVQGRASLGGNLCNASPAADSVPALIAAGAMLHRRRRRSGRRAKSRSNRCQTVAGHARRSRPDEILVAFRLPREAARARATPICA